MSMDQKNQYSQNGHITQSNIQMQCNPHQNPNDILKINRTKKSTDFCGSTKDTEMPK